MFGPRDLYGVEFKLRKPHPAPARAAAFLRKTLASEPVTAAEVRRLAVAAGIRLSTLYRMRADVGVQVADGRWALR